MLGSFKPFQKGHEKVLKEAIKNKNNFIYILVSNKEREGFSVNYFNILYSKLKQKYMNIEFIYCDNPLKDLFGFIKENKDNKGTKIKIYLGQDRKEIKSKLKQAFPEIKSKLVKRNKKDISGTLMRKWLMNNCKYSFLKGLPGCFSKIEKEEMWYEFKKTK